MESKQNSLPRQQIIISNVSFCLMNDNNNSSNNSSNKRQQTISNADGVIILLQANEMSTQHLKRAFVITFDSIIKVTKKKHIHIHKYIKKNKRH